MKWVFETHVRNSEKNGRIVAMRRLGVWSVMVDRCEQTGPWVHRMWKDAYEKLGHLMSRTPERILLLGLGAGGEIDMIQRRFPKAAITVVEHDPAMIALAHELRLFRPSPRITIIEGDAKEMLARLTERFDLITVDIFNGPEPSPLLTDSAFRDGLHARLAESGFLLVNVYQHVRYLNAFDERFLHGHIWKFEYNTLGIFRRADADMVKKLPDGFLPFLSWPEYRLIATIPKWLRPQSFEGGVRWMLWPLSFEQYLGDTEPRSFPPRRSPIRITMWQRLTRSDTPPGWRTFTYLPYRMTGFSELSGKAYYERWSETARRNRREWLAHLDRTYRLRPLSYPEFRKAYRTGTIGESTRSWMLESELDSRYKNGKEPGIFWGAERIKDGMIAAGIAVIDSPTASGSYYLAGFHTRETAKDPLMTGLFDHWFEECRKKGFRFVHFGNFWKPGDPDSWKGFSGFKAKFGPRFLIQPPVLYRFSGIL